MFYVYAIYNRARDKIYIGQTINLETRIKSHNKLLLHNRKSFTSRNSGLWELIHKEDFKTRPGAIKREKELKSHQGRDFIRNLIKE